MDTLIEVLKWVGIVVAAGFIGYLGRYLAMLILERVPKKREASPPPTPALNQKIPPDPEIQLEEARLKVDKKQAKAEAKKAKKTPRG